MRRIALFTGIIVIIFLACNSSDTSTEGFLHINESKIHYKSQGDGEPLLFLHGGYLNLDMWDEQTSFFVEKGFQVIRYSDLGHGKTKNNDSTLYNQVIIDSLLQHLAIDKISIIGLSWGSMLGIDYTMIHPEKVDKLVLVSPGMNGWNYFQDSLAAENYKLRKLATENNDKKQAAYYFYKNWVIGPGRNEANLDQNFTKKAMTMIESTMNEHWKESWSLLDTINTLNHLTEIKNETLILFGDQDASDILSIVEIYQAKLPNATTIVGENLAHAINLENPTFFNESVLGFLE